MDKIYDLDKKPNIDSISSELTHIEKEEIENYNTIYYIGKKENKINKYKLYKDFLKDSETFSVNERYRLINNDHIEYRYQIKSILGKGAYGDVVKVLDHKYQTEKAIKIFSNLKKFDVEENDLIFECEYKILELLRKRKENYKMMNDVFTLFYYGTKFRYHNLIVFKLYRGNLYSSKDKICDSSTMDKVSLIKNILYGLDFLTSSNPKIIHGDLKPENIFFKNDTFEVVIGDFGLSKILTKKYIEKTHFIQTRWYRSPEIIFGIPYNEKIDMWSMGCMIYEIVRGKPLFPASNDLDQIIYIQYILGCPTFEYIDSNSVIKVHYDNRYKPLNINTMKNKTLFPRDGSNILDRFFVYDKSRYDEYTKYQLIRLVYLCLEYSSDERISCRDAIEFITKHC